MIHIKPAERLLHTKTYYFAEKLIQVRALQEQFGDIINLGIGNPDLPPHPSVIESLHKSAMEPTHHGYQPYKGISALRMAMSNYYLNNHAVKVDPDHEVLPLMGSKEGITHISLAFLNPGDKVLVPELGYPAYAAVTRMVGATPLFYPLTETYYPDWDKLETTDMSDVKLMWLNYPHMPTGTPALKKEFEKFVDFAKRRNILLCHDNPYSKVLNQDRPISIFEVDQDKSCSLELNSLSKSFNMAGWRIGWITASKKIIGLINTIKTNFDSGSFRGLQDAAVTALQLPESWHQTRNDIYLGRRKIAEEIMVALGCNFNPEQTGMFLWGKIPEEQNSAEDFIEMLLEKKHIFIAPGFIFGNAGKRYIRISLCADQSVLASALTRLR